MFCTIQSSTTPPVLRALRLVVLAALCVTLLSAPTCAQKKKADAVVVGGTPSGPVPPVPGSGPNWNPGADNDPGPTVQIVFNLINARRKALKLTPLTWHVGLKRVAHLHSTDIVDNGYPIALTNPNNISVYTRIVSATPPMSYTRADAYVFGASTAASNEDRAIAIYNRLYVKPGGQASIEDPTMTHFGGRFVLASRGVGALIFAQNITP